MLTKQAQQFLQDGTILKDVRCEFDNTRMQIVKLGDTFACIIKKNGNIDEFATGHFNELSLTSLPALLKDINKLFAKGYSYQTGGGVLKSPSYRLMYHYMEFMMKSI